MNILTFKCTILIFEVCTNIIFFCINIFRTNNDSTHALFSVLRSVIMKVYNTSIFRLVLSHLHNIVGILE